MTGCGSPEGAGQASGTVGVNKFRRRARVFERNGLSPVQSTNMLYRNPPPPGQGRGVEERPQVSRSGALEVLLLRLSSRVTGVEGVTSPAVAGEVSRAAGAWEGAGGEAVLDLGSRTLMYGVMGRRYRLFRSEGRPLPSIFTKYCWCSLTSIIVPERSHLLGLFPHWFCTETTDPSFRGSRVFVCSARLECRVVCR